MLMILKVYLFFSSRQNIDPCLRLREETSDGCQRVTCNCQMQSELQGKHRQHGKIHTELEVIQPSHARGTQKLWRKSRERGPMIGISMALKYAQTMLKDLTALKNVFLFLVAAWMTQMQCNTLVQCNAALSAQTRSSHCILSIVNISANKIFNTRRGKSSSFKNSHDLWTANSKFFVLILYIPAHTAFLRIELFLCIDCDIVIGTPLGL